MAGNPRNETLETALVTTTGAIARHWSIEYARFFHYPTTTTTTEATDSTKPHRLKPLPNNTKKRRKGTWISSSSSSFMPSSSSMASLHLLTHETLGEVVLIVSFHGKVNEEHFISKLHFSWPQVSCLADCPVRGSRVVFASYRDWEGQIQKFAMRFSTSKDSQTFISCIKDSMKEVTNVGLSSSEFRSELACSSEFISPYGVHYSADEELGYERPLSSSLPPHQFLLNYGGYTCSRDPTVADELEGNCAILPPSFSTLLIDCCTEDEQEQPNVPEEIYPKSQIVRYMTESSFYDMLSKMENVIEELGGDLSL